jgi:hypothetical protein
MIMMVSLFDHCGPRRSGNFSHIIVKDVHRNGTSCQEFRLDRSVTALGQLAHDVRTNIFIRYLLLLILREGQTRSTEGPSNARSSLHGIKGFFTLSRHNKRGAFGVCYCIAISTRELDLMRANDICPDAAIQDDGIPDHFVSTVLSKTSFGILLAPALQKCKPHRAK